WEHRPPPFRFGNHQDRLMLSFFPEKVTSNLYYQCFTFFSSINALAWLEVSAEIKPFCIFAWID
ncbi:MAG: hypothetical protein J7M38_02835, partial [Armatimonadetes bacterium]|nr:hypothetical protein [Armatimonadota bacterium]